MLARGTLRRRLGVVLVATLTSIASFTTVGSAAALPPGPSNLAPDASTATGIPVLSWDWVAGATNYDVQVSRSSSFSPTIDTATTTSNKYVPDVALTGQIFWKVRARDASGTGPWTTASFTRSATAAPALLSPAEGAVIQPPEQSAVLSWTPVAGALNYKLEITPSAQRGNTDFLTTVTLKPTSYLFVPSNPVEYSWRVSAEVATGIFTAPADWKTFRAAALRPISSEVLPPNDSSQDNMVEDAVLDWQPVPGAVTYQLQIDTDDTFATPVLTQTGITGTSYARPVTLDNDQYYWRVRAVDAYGVATPWDEVDAGGQRLVPIFTFRRGWPEQPQLEYPGTPFKNGVVSPGFVDSADIDALYYQWKPVRLASSYVLEVADNATDLRNRTNVMSCTTVHTTFVPTTDECWPTTGDITYWHVLGVDNSGQVITEATSAEVFHFTYSSWTVTQIAPSKGYVGPTPTLQWEPVEGAATYRVVITSSNGGCSETVSTSATSYTPRCNMFPKADVGQTPPWEPKTFRWSVVPISEDGRVGNPPVSTDWTFTVTQAGGGPAASPEQSAPADGSIHRRFPTLSWTPMRASVDPTNGTVTPVTYRVLIRQLGAQGVTTLATTVTPRFEDTTTDWLSPGTYEWRVQAIDPVSKAVLAESSQYRSFTIEPLGPATGYKVALRGEATDADSCMLAGADDSANCDNIAETPILRWAPTDDAAFYRLYVSADRAFTNMFNAADGTKCTSPCPTVVDTNMFRAPKAYADSQAGTAYYWYVQPCVGRSGNVFHCDPLANASHGFEKRSNPVVLSSPADGASVADDVTLEWQDYVSTNLEPDKQPGGAPDTSVGDTARIEADKYRVQVATDSLFNHIVFTQPVIVDQRKFTLSTDTYPEGDLWWRVQAIDGSGNSLPFSAARKMTRKSPVPCLQLSEANGCDATDLVKLEPAPGAESNGSTFQWAPLAFAKSYAVEVYRNNDTAANPANLVVNYTGVNAVTQRAFTLPTPLEPVVDDAGDPVPYVWRVRRLDATGKTGAWSAWASFTVTGSKPTDLQPASGVRLAPNGELFTWEPEDASRPPAAWRFQRRMSGETTTYTEDVKTYARAYSPTNTLAATPPSWEWRVVALDSSDKPIGASDWRSFTVAAAPVAATKPVITGGHQVGSVLSVESPSWDPSTGVTQRYQWRRASSVDVIGTDIAGATDSTYTLTAADLNKWVTVLVTATLPGWANGKSESDRIVVVEGTAPAPCDAPTIEGLGKTGTTLTASAGTWSVDTAAGCNNLMPAASVKPAYQWQRNGAAISGQTKSSYTISATDVGALITVRVTAAPDGYATTSEVSNPITAVMGDAAGGTSVVIGVDTAVGSTLGIVTAPAWIRYGAPVTGVTPKYQWLRDGAPISGAAGTSYRLTSADADHQVRLQVSLVQSGYAPGAVESNSIVAVAGAAPIATTAPSISGTPAVGSKLTAKAGTWSPSGTYAYQWLRDGAPIPGATGSTYTVTLPDVQHSLSAQVTATAAGRAPGSATTAPVTVPKVVSKASMSLKSTKVKRKKKVAVTVTISASGVAGPTGTIHILAKGKVIATKTLSATQKGKMTFKVTAPKKKGKYPIVVRYSGSSVVAGSQSTAVRLKVT